MYKKVAALGLVFMATTACSLIGDPSGRKQTGTHPLKPGTEWVATSQDWVDEAKAVYSDASAYVTHVSKQTPVDAWVVILDVDETVLNNVEYQISRDIIGQGYTRESWFAWTQKEEATLVPGAADFIRLVNELGGHVALVTNRQDVEQLATEKNLAALGLRRHHDFRVLLTRASPEGASSKDQRFALVTTMLAAQGYPNARAVAFVGDNKKDKPALLQDAKFFCIDQGAMYGDPCAKVPRTGV